MNQVIALGFLIIVCLAGAVLAAPTPDQPWYDMEPNEDLTEPEGPYMGPFMGTIRRSYHAYEDYMRSAASSIRRMIYRSPFMSMMGYAG